MDFILKYISYSNVDTGTIMPGFVHSAQPFAKDQFPFFKNSQQKTHHNFFRMYSINLITKNKDLFMMQ